MKTRKLEKICKNVMKHKMPKIPVPAVEKWLTDNPGDPWVLEEARKLVASGDPLNLIAAAGAAARWWVPATTEEKRRLVQKMIAGGESPLAIEMKGFAGGLSRDQVRFVLAQALMDTDALAALISRLPTIFREIRSAEERAVFMDSIRFRRETLECIHEVLSAAGEGEVMKETLGRDDAPAKASLFRLLSTTAGTKHPAHLDAVGWIDPTAWWGTACVP